MFNLLRGFIDRIFVVIGAIFFAQAPHFFQAYTQRLGGHMAELHKQISFLRSAAEKSDKSLEEYIYKFISHTDSDIALQGEFMQSMQMRFTDISSAYSAMIHSTVLSRPFEFLHYIKVDVVKMTLQDFQFGLAFTAESGFYALIGMGVGYFLYSLIRLIISFPFKIGIGRGKATIQRYNDTTD